MISPERRRSVAFALAMAAVAASGLAHDRWIGRWLPDRAARRGLGRVGRAPLQLGTWRAEDRPTDAGDLKRAGIAEAALRTYCDLATGDSVTVLLVTGEPGPLAVHTPEVCYEGGGYARAGPAAASAAVPGFAFAEFAKTVPVPETLHIYWAWRADRAWRTPNSPRVAFALEPFIDKLYVVRTARTGESPESGACVRFLRDAAEAIGARLDEPAPGPPAPAAGGARPQPASGRG